MLRWTTPDVRIDLDAGGIRRRRDRIADGRRSLHLDAQAGGRPGARLRRDRRQRHDIDGVAFIDESAGYHDRHTAWKWSAGNGLTSDGRAVSWNLVTGVHDAPTNSERTVWIDGEPAEVGPVTFAPDLSQVTFAEGGSLEFTEWAARKEDRNMLLMRSRYRQPFGTFAGHSRAASSSRRATG